MAGSCIVGCDMNNKKLSLTDNQKELAKALSPLQLSFVTNLVSGMTQRQAIKKAGSTAKTDNSLDNVATQMFSRLEVKAFYDSLMETKLTDSIMGRDEALSILSNNARVAMTDVADYAFKKVGEDEEGQPIMQTVWTMKDSADIDPKVIACIKSVTMTKQGPKIELHDQQGAIKQLSAMQGWDAPKEIKADVSVTEVVRKVID